MCQAYALAKEVHGESRRFSGHLVLEHCLAVAGTLLDLGLDEASLQAALLHDSLEVVDDREFLLQRLEKEFGLEVALLVDGVSELRAATKKRFPYHQESVDNFRRLLLASVEDVRVLIIRLAEKIDNARTIEFLSPARQRHFAQKIFHLYSPLAEFVGLGAFKRELDDVAFAVLYPDDYHWLTKKMRHSRQQLHHSLQRLISQLEKELRQRRIKTVSIFGRTKSYWSIWQKIQRYLAAGKITKEDPSAILDQIGVTVLVPDVPSCYAALGVVHSCWSYLPEEFDDYISNPKPNGYRAIQTTIEWERRTAEIQIKTPKMHEYNEYGPASHIAYKVAGGKSVADASYSWIKELVSWRQQKGRRRYQVRVFSDYVYVLTPKGDIIQLKKGSTPVDFAFKIHTEVGCGCKGAKVNGRIVPLNYQLKNGEVVEILVDRRQRQPNADWLKFVRMSETRVAIRRALSRLVADDNPGRGG